MGKPKQNGADQPDGGTEYGIANRRTIITSAVEEICKIDADIEAAKEKHIVSLQKELTKAMRAAKKDLDIDGKDLKLLIAQRKREIELENFEDQGAADKVRDNLRELFATAAADGQLSWLQAVDDAPEKPKRPRHAREQCT